MTNVKKVILKIVFVIIYNLDHILIDEKLCESVLVYSISCKS